MNGCYQGKKNIMESLKYSVGKSNDSSNNSSEWTNGIRDEDTV